MKPISPFGLPIGITFSFWTLMGLFRHVEETYINKKPATLFTEDYRKIGIIIPAHNEELVIQTCISRLKRYVSSQQIFVVSDGSTDNTTVVARKEGCSVLDLDASIGKARSIKQALEKFWLIQQYEYILILDADTKVHAEFLPRALRLINDPSYAVVFATVGIEDRTSKWPNMRWYYISYRERLDYILRYFIIVGQTWKYTNAMPVVPGFCALYRTSVLSKVRIDTPGIVIEDFNLAFQIHKKKLGKIGYELGLTGWSQNPDNLKDYCRQVFRWNIGLFQTMKEHGIWPSFFWISLATFTFEMLVFSFSTAILPVYLILIITGIAENPNLSIHVEALSAWYDPYVTISLGGIIVILYIFDYLLSIMIGIVNKRPHYIVYGLFYFIVQYITACILLISIIPGFTSHSDGTWKSPRRQDE